MAGLNKYSLMTAAFIALTQTQLQNQGFGIFGNYWLHLLEETVLRWQLGLTFDWSRSLFNLFSLKDDPKKFITDNTHVSTWE